MAEVTSGVHSVLSSPFVYDRVQNLFGANRARAELVRSYFAVEPGQRVLDIGCGTAAILYHLPAVDYVGFDLSQRYVEAAQRLHPTARILCKRVDDAVLADLGTFDLVISIGVLHHLNDEEAGSFFRIAAAAMKPQGGRMVTMDPCLASCRSGVARWMIRRDRGQNVRSAEAYQAIAEEVFSHVETAIRHDMMRIPYTHLVGLCRR